MFADEETVTKLLVEATLSNMVGIVQQRAYNYLGVVSADPVDLGSSLKEALVWGIDSYTRRMIELLIEDICPDDSIETLYFCDSEDKDASKAVRAAQFFIEKCLLPNMNCRAPEEAYDMSGALLSIAQVV